MAGWPALLVGAGIAAGSAAGPSYVGTALQGEQARVVDPGPPTGLTATPGRGQVSLSWIPPASDGGAQITGYDVYEGTTANVKATAPVTSSKSTSVTVKNRAQSLGRALERLPRVTREAAIREAAAAAAALLKVDLIDVLVAGWRDHRDITAAARRTLVTPASKELVGLAPHRVTTIQQPSVSILIDGRRVHTLQLGLSIIFDVTGLVAGVAVGRLAGIHSGRCEIGVALTVHEIEILTKRSHLELPGVMALKSGVRLLPASEYPASTHSATTPAGSEHSGSMDPGTQFPESQFPAVELAGAQPAGAEY